MREEVSDMKRGLRVVAFLLAVVMTVLSLPLSAYGAARVEVSDADYSLEGAEHAVTVSPSRLLTMLTGMTPSAAEADYLDRYFDRMLLYYDRIPVDRIYLERDGETVDVRAEAFSYEAKNGQVVEWVPTEVLYGEREAVTLTERGGVYLATLSGVSAEEGSDLRVVYACRLRVPTAMADALVSFAYAEATAAEGLPTAEEYASALARYRAYLSAMEDYREAVAAYEQYRSELAEYERASAVHAEYVKKKAAYDQAFADYTRYEEALATYRAEKTAYDRLHKEYQKNGEDYVRYLSELNRVRVSMYAMESLFLIPDDGKTGTLFKALQNAELVTMFERYRDTLEDVYQVSGDTLTHLRKTSDELNEFLRGYAAARAVSEEEAFSYYRTHYEAISELFNYLYENMREIMTGIIFNHICAMMEVEYGKELGAYKKWRVKNILCHIYLICLCLDDGRTADGEWKFYTDGGKNHPYAFTDLLAQNLILTDIDRSSPLSLSYPETVERMEAPTAPTEPAYVEKPIAPVVVTEPTPPVAVTEPTEPTPVAPVSEPTDKDREGFALAARASALVAEKRAGVLPQRKSGDILSYTLTVTKETVCPIAFGEHPMVTYYNGDGSYLGATEVAQGERVPLRPTDPTWATDAAYTYEFRGWGLSPDATGEEILTSEAQMPTMGEQDLSLYAIYRKDLRSYSVTILLDENDPSPTVVTCAYGTMPPLPTTLQKEQTPQKTYAFAGWSPTPTAVTGEATYVAKFISSDRTYRLSYETPTGTVEKTALYGETPTPPALPTTYYEGCVRYDLIGWTPTLSSVTADAVYTASYRRTVLTEAEEETPRLTAQTGEYRVEFSGERIRLDELLRVSRAEERRVVLICDALTVTLDSRAVSSMRTAGVTYAALLRHTDGGVGMTFFDANGEEMTLYAELYLSIPYTESAGYPCLYATDASGYARRCDATAVGGRLETVGRAGVSYRADCQYGLTVETVGGATVAAASRYRAGDALGLLGYPDEEHILFSAVLVNDATGEQTPVENLSRMTMPAYHATLRVTYVPKTYTVTFISRGQTVFTGEFRLGDVVPEPKIETDFEENGYRYTFIGWSQPIGQVTGNVTYTAKFFAANLAERPADVPNDGSEWAVGTVIWQIGLPAVILLGVLVAALVFLVLWLVRLLRPSKPKKAKATQAEEGTTPMGESAASVENGSDDTSGDDPQ